MKIGKNISLFIIFLTLLVTVSSFVTKALAQTNYTSGNAISLEKDQVVNEDYFAAGGTVIVDGTVNGDAYVAGGTVVINGTVNGDILATGGNISINGKITGNVRVAGGQIAISGDIGRNVTTAGGSVTIQHPARIVGSVTAASGNLSLLAPIGRGVTMAGNQITIDSPVGGNVTGAAEQLDVLRNASIAGRLTYWSNTQAHIANFTVRDGVTNHHTNWNTQKPAQPANPTAVADVFVGFGIIWAIVSLATSFIIGLILLYFVPVYTKDIYITLTTKPLVSLGIGFLTVILMPIAFVVLLVTIIGIPLAFILLISFILFVLLNGIFIAYAIGKKLLPQRNALALLIGLIITGIISIIPIIGWIWNAIALFIGMGAIVMVEKQLYVSLRDKKII